MPVSDNDNDTDERVVRDMGVLVRGDDGTARATHSAIAVRGYDRERLLLRVYGDAVWVRAHIGRARRSDSPAWWSAAIDREFWMPLAAVAEASGLVSADVRRAKERADARASQGPFAGNYWDADAGSFDFGFDVESVFRRYAGQRQQSRTSAWAEEQRRNAGRAGPDPFARTGRRDWAWWKAKAQEHLKARRIAEYEAAMRMVTKLRDEEFRAAAARSAAYTDTDPRIPTDQELRQAREKVADAQARAYAGVDFGFDEKPARPEAPKKYEPKDGRAGKQKKGKGSGWPTW